MRIFLMALVVSSCVSAQSEPVAPGEMLAARFDRESRRGGGAGVMGDCVTVHGVTSCALEHGGALDLVIVAGGLEAVDLSGPNVSVDARATFNRTRAALSQTLGSTWPAPTCEDVRGETMCTFRLLGKD